MLYVETSIIIMIQIVQQREFFASEIYSQMFTKAGPYLHV
jgi:hypothetical protein